MRVVGRKKWKVGLKKKKKWRKEGAAREKESDRARDREKVRKIQKERERDRKQAVERRKRHTDNQAIFIRNSKNSNFNAFADINIYSWNLQPEKSSFSGTCLAFCVLVKLSSVSTETMATAPQSSVICVSLVWKPFPNMVCCHRVSECQLFRLGVNVFVVSSSSTSASQVRLSPGTHQEGVSPSARSILMFFEEGNKSEQ